MPRTRRTPASETPAEDAAALETPPVTADTPAPDAPAADSGPAKPIRRRAPRTPKAEAISQSGSPDAPATSPDAPATEIASETQPTSEPDAAPPRRRGRRPAAALPDLEAPVIEAPAAETPAPTRRRGRRVSTETPATETPATETPATETPAAEAAPPQPAPRRRGRRPAAAAETPDLEAPASETPPPAPRRRRGRAVTPPEAVPEETAPETLLAEVAEGTPQEEAAPKEAAPRESQTPPASRRRRGRRSAALGEDTSAPSPPETAFAPELPDVEAPVAEDGEETEDTAEDSERKGRRRRGRKRRGGSDEPTTESLEAAGAALLLPEEVAPPADEEEDDAFVVYPPPAAPTFVAPPLVPPVLPPADLSSAPRVSARLQQTSALARLVVNDTAYSPYLFFVNTEAAANSKTVDDQIREAAANGIHLFSGMMSLPLQNAYGDRPFGAIDALVQQIIAADPDGWVLPRLQFFPTNYWARTHPEEMARDAQGDEGDVSLASTDFWADCVDALDALIAHFADPSTPGGDRVIGFHLDRGEWFTDPAAGYDLSQPNRIAFSHWLHAKYQNLYALRAAWHDSDVTWENVTIPSWPGQATKIKKTDTPLLSTRHEGRWPDYAQYSSETVAGIIAALAEAVKTLSQNRLLVAASYGYTLEFAGRSDSGHLALGLLLDSPHIDIVAGPNSYTGRGAGSPAAFPAPLDSVALHGKLWLVEDDTKTFLADTETEDDYNPKIESGADTQAIHQRHFGAALAHRAGVTWMDLWGQGWLRSPDIWRELGALTTQAERWEQLAPAAPPPPDVAMIVDEASLRFLQNDPDGLGTHLVTRTRDLALRAGASVGFYLQSDITRPDFPASKLCLFVNALRLTTEERQAVREKLQKPGRTLAWLYAAGLFDENGPSEEEAGEVVGMALRAQPWNSRGGSMALETRNPITERMRGPKKIGTEEILNPLFAVSDPQATVLAEYLATGAASLAAREHKSGWKSVFFGDPDLTLEMLRGLYAYAGVSVFDAQDDVVYAGADGSLTLHGPFTGQRTVTLPRRASVYDVFDDKIIAADTRTFRTFLRVRTTRVFLWGDSAALARTTGLELPAPQADPEPAPPPNSPPPSSPQPADLREQSSPQPLPQEIPGLEDFEDTGEESPGEESPGEESEGTDDGTEAPTRRSRWQRRRAAARARRDTERAARLAEGTPDTGSSANPPPDIESVLPGLPPRRLPAPVAAERIAGIVAEETAEAGEIEETEGAEEMDEEISDEEALTFSDAALMDMADDAGAAETEAEE